MRALQELRVLSRIRETGEQPLSMFPPHLDSEQELYPGSLAKLQGAVARPQPPLPDLDPAGTGGRHSAQTRGPSTWRLIQWVTAGRCRVLQCLERAQNQQSATLCTRWAALSGESVELVGWCDAHTQSSPAQIWFRQQTIKATGHAQCTGQTRLDQKDRKCAQTRLPCLEPIPSDQATHQVPHHTPQLQPAC